MENYKAHIQIDAPLKEVYAALTQPEKLRGWWTTHCDVSTEVGGQSTFHFDKNFFVMKNEKLLTNQEVVWQCVGHHFENLDGDPAHKASEWIGTRVDFKLKENEKKWTELYFEHQGLTPALQCYASCESGWDHFLKTSLKRFVEARKGQPYLSKY
jgi:uncharacterized protein YndB with AHSA1/START domain